MESKNSIAAPVSGSDARSRAGAGRDFDIVPDPSGLTRLWARGKTLQDLFRACLAASAECAYPWLSGRAPRGARAVSGVRIQAVDLSSLLVEFLSEALAQGERAGAVFSSAEFRAFGENFLEGEIAGAAVPEDRAPEIRGVMYDTVEVKKNPETGLFEATLTLEA